MLKALLIAILCVGFCSTAFTEEITGFWKMIDDKTKKDQGIIAIYEYKGKYYGRIVATYDDHGNIDESINAPITKTKGIEGDPYYAGLDLIWDLVKGDPRYTDGEIVDPETGKIYEAEAWVENGNLVVRGELLFIGRNEKWPPAKDSDFRENFAKPDVKTFIPKIPKGKS